MVDWRAQIAELVLIKQAISDADNLGLWEFHLPRVAASEAALSNVQRAIGWRLDEEYLSFLACADGWPSFFQSVDLFGVVDLGGGPRMDVARGLVSNLEHSVVENAGLSSAQLVPIAATTVDLDVFVSPVVDGVQQPTVVWIAGYEIDRFESFGEFFHAMAEYNRGELAALQKR